VIVAFPGTPRSLVVLVFPTEENSPKIYYTTRCVRNRRVNDRISVNLGIQLSPFVWIRNWFSESIIRPCVEVDTNALSTLPMTVNVDVEEIVEPHGKSVGDRHTVRGKPSVVSLETFFLSDTRPLDGDNQARTRPRLCAAR